ncbi:site-specific DNA-methyltransferase, partial [Desulfonatronospira sp.]|uniref:site-specific DNA-methyltransferase n=1 Tax=Desulfonatronospira sp. TaxID=1962951 RepID=UPI0025C4D121
WRGKDEQDWSDLVVSAPPLYIQEKVHPKVLVDDLLKQSKERAEATQPQQLGFDLFADFDGLPQDATATDFYKHDANWSNRMILGDSLQVMASLAEREGLRGKVQCIYLDPPYGIKFNSNFQWSTTSRDVKDGKLDNITREPEQVKAFRDTWRDGIHSYLSYLRDRLTVARDLLTDSGSIFVQIGDENVHRVRALLDEVFGEENFCTEICFATTSGLSGNLLSNQFNFLLWYTSSYSDIKYRQPYKPKGLKEDVGSRYTRLELPNGTRRFMLNNERGNEDLVPEGTRIYRHDNLTSQSGSDKSQFQVPFEGYKFSPGKGHWKTHEEGLLRLKRAQRLGAPTSRSLAYVRFLDDFPVSQFSNVWTDTQTGAFTESKVYVVQTNTKVIERCILMTTDPGDLVLDPTCGSGTTAYVAEQWGRRWITIDTSRVALALARARIMGARYPYYLLTDSPEGQKKEAEITRNPVSQAPTYRNIRQGFVYERVPHITLKAIANNTEIDTIYEQWQPKVEGALADINTALTGHPKPYTITTGGRDGKNVDFTTSGTVKLPSGEDAPANALLEWEVPREAPTDWPQATHEPLERFWKARIGRQREIDASIAAKADQEYLYDKPYEDKNTVRVAGPFTVESLSPHRVLVVDENDELVDPNLTKPDRSAEEKEFADVILENLKVAGVQQAHKEGKINFTTIVGWPGEYICAEGRYVEGESETEKRAGIFIGPEFGTVSRADLVAATREAGDAGFDVLISCAFNYDAHSAEFTKLGRIPVLKARMNADLHMADELKTTGAGNLFVIFGEPDIDIDEVEDGQIQVKIHGIDVFHPQSGEVRSSSPDEIACWFIDTDYNEESFFVRHAYFLGASDPYKSLKTTLKAEIDEEAWESLYSDTSRPFDKPKSGRIAVKVINHLGDEVMKVFSVV